MTLDPFDPFPSFESSNQAWEAIFRRPLRGGASGGATARLKAEAAAAEEIAREAEEDFRKEDKVKDPPPPPAPEARLSKPEWGGSRGFFNEKITLSVEGELPAGISHLTRVTFTVYALKDGDVDRIGAQEGHLRDGKAVAEVLLWTPQFRDAEGNLVKECEYAFKAKHRYSPEIESNRLKGQARDGASTTFIELELFLDDGKTPRAGAKYVLTASDGKVHEGTLDDKGRARIEPVAPGEATVAFPDLPTDLAYSLLVERKGAGPYHVFKDVPFAELDGFVS